MPEKHISIQEDGQAVTIDISSNYFGNGFPWFRAIAALVALTVIYFVTMPHVLSALPALNTMSHINIIKYLAIMPFLIVFFLIHFMGFHIRTKDSTSYFLSLAFYSPRIIATPQEITIIKRWFIRRQTTHIPTSQLKEFKTSPWFQFIASTQIVTISDRLKTSDGRQVRTAINKAIKANSKQKTINNTNKGEQE